MQSISVLAVLALAFSCSLAFDAKVSQHWQLWKTTYNKQYSNAEEIIRYEILLYPSKYDFVIKIWIFSRAIWESNLKIVQEHNLEADMGVHTFTLGMNAYADMVNISLLSIDS